MNAGEEDFSYSILLEEALAKLIVLGTSEFPEHRLRAAQIITKLDSETASYLDAVKALLEKLLHDTDPLVAMAAIKAVAILREEKFYQILVDYLDIPAFQSVIMPILMKANSQALNPLESALDSAWEKGVTQKCKLLIMCLGHIKHARSIQILLHYLQKVEHRVLRYHLLESLETVGYHIDPGSKIDPLMQEELNHMKLLMHFLKEIKGQKGCEQFYVTLVRELSLSQRQIFFFLGFIYPKDAIHNIFFYLQQRENVDKSSYALELLENILLKGHKPSILPIIRESYFMQFLPRSSPDVLGVIEKILSMPTYKITSIVKAMALYTIGHLHLTGFTRSLEQMKVEKDFLVRETADWVIKTLQIKKDGDK